MSRIFWLILAAAMFTLIPWVIASTFWSFGTPPPTAQFAPRQDAIVVSTSLEEVNASRGRFAPDVQVTIAGEEAAIRLSGLVYGSTGRVRAATALSRFEAGQGVRVFEDGGQWYESRFRVMDIAAWLVSLFCAFVGLVGLAGIGFTALGGRR